LTEMRGMSVPRCARLSLCLGTIWRNVASPVTEVRPHV
jgi:hypothetical protein